MASTPDYSINYDDERFGKVESDKNQALTEIEQTYGGMIDSSDKFFEDQIQASKDWADKQAQIQQDNTDFAIEQINQQKEQANKDYKKEQSASYVDWQKQSNPYGAEAEKIASLGLANTGYSESSQVSMYNTYQNRVATARESYNNAVLNYNNAIKDAQLQNNAALAEIAYNALQQQLELSLQGFQYKNQLITEKLDKKTAVNSEYYGRWMDVLNQMNTENALKEDVRQYNETMAWNTEQAQLDRNFQKEENAIDRTFKAKEAELDRQHEIKMQAAKTADEKALLELQHKQDMEKLEKDKENEKELLRYNYELNNSSGDSGKTVSSSSIKESSSSSRRSSTTSGKSLSATSKAGGSTNAYKPKYTSSTQNKSSSASNNINMQSVLALGYGPISAAKLAQLVKEGKVKMVTKNGEQYAVKVFS